MFGEARLMSNSRLYWQCFGKSVQGVSHVRANLPNQDAIAWFPEGESSSGSTPIIVAVSDGHEAAKIFVVIKVLRLQFQLQFASFDEKSALLKRIIRS